MSREHDALLADAAAAAGIEESRVAALSTGSLTDADDAPFVLYWMRAARRATHNEALAFSAAVANSLKLPLVVLAIVDAEVLRSNSIRHALFQLEGLAPLSRALTPLGATLCVRVDPAYTHAGTDGAVSIIMPDLGFGHHARVVVVDEPHMKPEVKNVQAVVDAIRAPVYAVETELIVPANVASNVYETEFDEFYSIRWLPKMGLFLHDLPAVCVHHTTPPDTISALGWGDELPDGGSTRDFDGDGWLENQTILKEHLRRAGVDVDVATEASPYKGGEIAAKKLLQIFTARKIKGYSAALAAHGEDNRAEFGSLLSPYLTFGFISPVTVTNKIATARGIPEDDRHAVLRNLGRRECSYNLVRFVPDYDNYENIVPDWARQLLEQQSKLRNVHYDYTMDDWAMAKTHDPAWNSVQVELLTRGRNCGLNRRFWCSKIIEYASSPANAFELARTLNDKYMLDAGNAVGHSSVAECFGRFQSPNTYDSIMAG